MKLAVRGRGSNDIEMTALERKKQEEEAQGLMQIIENREALKAQLQAENDSEYSLPGDKCSHKPLKGKVGLEGVAVDEDGRKRKGRGKKSRIPDVTELATHILEADKIVGKEKEEGNVDECLYEDNTRKVAKKTEKYKKEGGLDMSLLSQCIHQVMLENREKSAALFSTQQLGSRGKYSSKLGKNI